MRTYHPGSKDQLVQGSTREDDSSTGPLNFRLQVKTDTSVGTWSVWNLERRGDHTVVPLRLTPLARPAQVKIGFDEGIILRIPRDIGLELPPRLVYEIGFWHPTDMRRTVVVEYKTKRLRRLPWRPPQWHLREIVAIQMQRERPERFVGNFTDPEATRVLPETAPFHISDCNMTSFQVHRVESVNLQTMARVDKEALTDNDSECRLIEERIAHAFNTGKSNHGSAGRRIFRCVLPNEILVSLPTTVVVGARRNNNKSSRHPTPAPPLRTMFALYSNNAQSLQVVELTYDTETTKALAVRLYSLHRP
jgi:hypothetical protein